LRIGRRSEASGEDERVKALTDAQLEAVLAEIRGESRLFLRFVFEAGLRIGEAIEVRWADVTFGDVTRLAVDRQFYRGRIQPPKGGKRRKVPIGEAMARELWRVQAGGDELVFTAERGGRIIPSNLMSRTLKPAAVRAGFGEWVGRPARAETWVGFHTLRHSCATSLFRSGWNAAQIQRFLGHSDPGFTLRTYIHLLDEDLPEVQFGGNDSGNQTTRDEPSETFATAAPIAVVTSESPDVPRHAERAVANS
jgi:integrase